MATAKRELKLVGRELNEALATAESTLIKNLTRAERENATVYLQRIPNVADLPKKSPACLPALATSFATLCKLVLAHHTRFSIIIGRHRYHILAKGQRAAGSIERAWGFIIANVITYECVCPCMCTLN